MRICVREMAVSEIERLNKSVANSYFLVILSLDGRYFLSMKTQSFRQLLFNNSQGYVLKQGVTLPRITVTPQELNEIKIQRSV